ncbi:enoyl-CoA hydratase [Gordonia terrae]
MKKLAIVVLLAAFAAAMVSGVGQASAAPIPQVSSTGYNFGIFGDHSYCRGAVNATVDAPKGKRGVVRVTVRSHGFTGAGASWKRNPNCRVLFGNYYTSVRGYNLEKWVTASFGPRAGEKKVWEINTGSGPASLGFGGFSPNSPVRVPSGYGSTIYMLVP